MAAGAKRGKESGNIRFPGIYALLHQKQYGCPLMLHKTARKGMIRKLQGINEWFKSIRSTVPLKEWWPGIKAKLVGHYNYFGINGNIHSLQKYYWSVRNVIYKWINRRGQKKSMTVEEYSTYLQWNPLPTPRVYHAILY